MRALGLGRGDRRGESKLLQNGWAWPVWGEREEDERAVLGNARP